uniref:Uncharacterized protein n=1 Tax=Anopheles atroparvus TaxID=41427 RepID=A0AAG5DTD0_ANOAO
MAFGTEMQPAFAQSIENSRNEMEHERYCLVQIIHTCTTRTSTGTGTGTGTTSACIRVRSRTTEARESTTHSAKPWETTGSSKGPRESRSATLFRLGVKLHEDVHDFWIVLVLGNVHRVLEDLRHGRRHFRVAEGIEQVCSGATEIRHSAGTCSPGSPGSPGSPSGGTLFGSLTPCFLCLPHTFLSVAELSLLLAPLLLLLVLLDLLRVRGYLLQPLVRFLVKVQLARLPQILGGFLPVA